MKLLSRICLLQFFLYEREDLEVGRNTAFLGPNGTGKTCLLDAVQTVILGADTNRVHFNAQADGKRRDRSLRSYCLGIYDQSDHGRCRDASTTYISLVFRDEATGEVVTAGVALSARVDATEHTFHGLYILPGVDLTTGDLVETESGQQRIIPWKDAQYRFKRMVEEAGGRQPALVTQNREEFVRKLLLEHLAAPGDKPNPMMFRNAFQRSLQLKVMDDLSNALRDYLIEARPTNIREFKARADQFRQMRDLVQRIRNQIAVVAGVRREYERVRSLRVREANYYSLAATLDVEALGERSSGQEDEMARLEVAITTAQAQIARAEAEVADAMQADRDARDARARDKGYQDRAASSQLLQEREKGLGQARSALHDELQAMLRGVVGVGRQPAMEPDRGAFERAGNALSVMIDGLGRDEVPDAPAVQSLAETIAKVAGLTQRRAAAIDQAHEALRSELEAAKRAHQRVAAGLTRLADPVDILQRRLQEEGIDAIPVCDLVEVTQSRWQPVIEAFLGLNVQALLVPREREEDAVKLYRALKKSDAIYGAKLAPPSRTRPWRASATGLLAAELIRGDNADAVAYLQGELGQIECVDTERQLLASRRAFTDDGMVAAGAGIDRRRLPGELQIGRQNREASRQLAQRELQRLTDAVAQSDKQRKPFADALSALSAYASTDGTLQRLNRLTVALEGQVRGVKDAREQQHAASSGDLATLDERVRLTTEALETATRNAKRWNDEHVASSTRLEGATADLVRTQRELEQAQARERSSWQDPLYDGNEVNRLREKLEAETDESAQATLVDTCRNRAAAAGRNAGAAEVEAGTQLSQYRIEFSVNADIPADWQGRALFVTQEHVRLETLTLAEKEAEAEQALKAAEEVFRTDVVQSLLTGFDRIKEQITALNHVLRKAPEFSNRERYVFRHHVVDQHRPLYEFLQQAREMDAEDSLWGEAGKLPPEFRELMEADASSPLLHDSSPLYDYRRFFAFDIEILRDGESIGVLSKRFGPGSGGEHRTPLYVIFGASLAAAYGNLHGRNAGGGLMLLDEAFDKMDATNVRAVADYLNSLGLQLLMAGPETDQPKLSGFLEVYYDMARHGSRTIRLEKYVVSQAARELLASDNPLYHPELLEQEIARLRGDQVTDESRTVDA